MNFSRQQHYCYILFLLSMPAVCLSAPYLADGYYKHLDASITRVNNLSKAWVSDDVVDDTMTSLTIGGGYSRHFGQRRLFVLSGYASVRKLARYSELDSLDISVSGKYLFQPRPGYNAAAYEIGIDITSLTHDDSQIRDGELVEITLGVSRRFGARGFVNLSYHHRLRFTDSPVFETRDQKISFSPEFTLNDSVTLYLDLQYVSGDLIASATGRPDSNPAALRADARVLDPAFDDCPRACTNWTYRYEGEGTLAAMGMVIQFEKNLSLDLSARRFDINADAGIGYADWSAMLALSWYF